MIAPASIRSTGRVPRQQKRQFIGPQQDWDQFINNKPEWISSRLQHVEFFSDNGYFDLKMIEDAMEKRKKIYS